MKKGKRLSQLVEKLDGSREAQRILCEEFLPIARRKAQQLMDKRVQGPEGPTAIASAAVRSALSDLESPGRRIATSDEFQALLLGIVRRKVIDAGRRARADKRGGDREIGSLSTATPSPSTTPEAELDAKTLAEDLAVATLEETTELKRIVNLLGVLSGYSVRDIQNIFDRSPELGPAPSVNVIRAILYATRKRLARQFGVENDDD